MKKVLTEAEVRLQKKAIDVLEHLRRTGQMWCFVDGAIWGLETAEHYANGNFYD